MGSFGSGHYFNQDRGTCEPLRRPKKSCDVSLSLLSPEFPLRSLYHAVLYVPRSEVSRTQTPIGSVLWLLSSQAESRPSAWQVGPPPPQASLPVPPVAFPERQQEGGKCERGGGPTQGKPLGPTGSLYGGMCRRGPRGGGRGGFCVRSRGTKRHQWTRGVGAVRRHRCGEELGSPAEERRGRGGGGDRAGGGRARGGSGQGLGHGRRGHPEALVSPQSQGSGAPGNRGACKHKRGWH